MLYYIICILHKCEIYIKIMKQGTHMSSKTNSKYTVPSIDKAIDIIRLLSLKPNLTFKQIVEELNLPLSTSFNIINTLQNRGFVEKNKLTSQYTLGLTLMRIGMQIYQNIDIRKFAYPIMKELVSKFGETSYLTGLDNSTFEGVVLDKIESLKTVTVVRSIGSKVPLYASATGKSLLSGFTPEELEDYLCNVTFIKFTDKTIANREMLMKELEKIRNMGYTITEDEMGDGASAVSAPIKDNQGNVVAAISIAGPMTRMENQIPSMIPEVKIAAERISKLIWN